MDGQALCEAAARRVWRHRGPAQEDLPWAYGCSFTVPYTYEGKSASYLPDYIVRLHDGQAEPLNLIGETSQENRS